MEPWGHFTVSEYEAVHRVVGDLAVHLRIERGALVVGIDAPPGPLTGFGPTREERWAAPGAATSVEVVPALPDRPVVVGVRNPFRLAPGAETRLQVHLPVWAQIHLEDAERTLLTEVPSAVLSPTWWGGKTRGELAYWLPAEVEHAEADIRAAAPTRAVCVLRIANRSTRVLEVDRLAIRAPQHSLFRTGRGFVTDEARIVYLGDADAAVDVSGAAPAHEPDAPRVQGPRLLLPRGLRALTFAHLRSLELY